MKITLKEESKEEIEARMNQLVLLNDMRFHETIEFCTGMVTYAVTRVPGGWIYNHMRLDSGQMTSVFIPFNNDFQKLI